MKIIKKGNKKCYGLLLVLFIMFGLSSSVYLNDSSALKHEYNGIIPASYLIPYVKWNDNHTSVVWDFSRNIISSSGAAFSVGLQNDAWSSSLSSSTDIQPNYPASIVSCDNTSTDSSCNISSDPISQYSVTNRQNVDGYIYNFSIGNIIPSFISEEISLSYYNIGHRLSTFEEQNINTILSYNPLSNLTCGAYTNGALCSGLWNKSDYVNNKVLPYWYSTDGFYVHSKAIDDNGIHYTNTFSLSDMYNYDFPRISHLIIPLSTDDDYFFDSDNLYSGRHFEFAGAFEFDGSFAWNPNAVSNGSFTLTAVTFSATSINSYASVVSYPCDTNLITLSTLTRLEYSCSFDLTDSYLAFIPRLSILGGSESCSDSSCYNYLWETNDKWRFASVFVVTDNDDTSGGSFNSNLTGGGTIPGDAGNSISSGNEDWFSSLTGMFDFSMINPFSGLFGLFADNSSCVDIPILAGMLNSEETTYCPWFDSSVRNVLTPVLGISSVMLLFGFVVRWLGSSSGNFFEDSKHEEISNVNHSGWRRYKK